MDIPTELLRTVVAVVETGSLAKAGDRVGRTASAISLQLSRLESLLGIDLFERKGRRLMLTAAGDALVGHARDILDRHDAAVRALTGAAASGRVRLGLVQDFVDPLLPAILSAIRSRHPFAQIEVRVAGSAELRQAVASAELDVALACRGDAPGKPVRVEPMVWVGEARLAALDDLPLALVSRPCPFADAALGALDAAGRRHHLAMRTPSLSGVQAAIRGGLGIGCRTRLLAVAGLKVLGAEEGLPPLPEIEYSLFRGRGLSAAADTAAQAAAQALNALP